MTGFWGGGFFASGFWASAFWSGQRDREAITAPGGGGTGRFAELVPARPEPIDLEAIRRKRKDEDALVLALLQLF